MTILLIIYFFWKEGKRVNKAITKNFKLTLKPGIKVNTGKYFHTYDNSVDYIFFLERGKEGQ